MTSGRRRAIFERVVDRWSRLGFEFEASPVFRASVDEWIEGQISFDELKERYAALFQPNQAPVSGERGTDVGA